MLVVLEVQPGVRVVVRMLKIGAPIPLVQFFEQIRPILVHDHLAPRLASPVSDFRIAHA